jgi:hypothetical protein
MHHIGAESILDFRDGKLSEAEAARVHRHIVTCGTCAKKFAQADSLLQKLSRVQRAEIPDDVLKRAFGIFQPLKRRSTAILNIVDRVASLVFDSWTGAGVAGMRGGWGSGARQLSMKADEFDLHLGVAYDEESTGVRGQLLARRQSGFNPAFSVLLIGNDGDTLGAAVANEFGEFAFERQSFEGATFSIRLKEGAAVRAITFQLPAGDRA